MNPRTNALRELNSRIMRIEGRGRLAESFTRIQSAVESLANLHDVKDSTITPDAHTLKVGRAAKALQDKLGAMKDQALSAYTIESGRIAGQVVEKLNLKESKYGEELRRLIVTMPLSDRIQYVTDLAKDPEAGPMLAALTSAPSVLHGVPRDVLKATEDAFVATHAPELTALQQDLDSALDLVSAAHRTAASMASEYQDARELERIDAASKAAAEAQQRMQEALA